MINLYFEKPKNAVIKINNHFVTSFPFKASLSDILFFEYLPYSCFECAFACKFELINHKLSTNGNIELIKWNDNNYSVNYMAKSLPMPFNILQIFKEDSRQYILVSSVNYKLIVLQNDKVIKIFSLPSFVQFPALSITKKHIIIDSTTIDKKYLFVADKFSFLVLLSKRADSFTCYPTYLLVKTIYNDSVNRVCYQKFNYPSFNKISQTFEHKKSGNNLPLMFIDAYIAEDISQIKGILSFDVDFELLKKYLGKVKVVLCPLDSGVHLVNNDNACYKVAKKLVCKISNNKIDTFELV